MNRYLSKVSNFFRVIDVFGTKTELKLDNNLRFNTCCGGLMTVLYFGLFLGLFISLGSDMMNHANPTTTFTKDYAPTPESTNISKDSYFFIFGLQDSNAEHFYDESIYSAILINQAFNSTVPFIPLNNEIMLERCTVDHLPTNNLLRDYFQNVGGNISELLCFPRNLSETLKIRGTWANLNFEIMRIEIRRCQNSSENGKPVCKSPQELENQLGQGYFGFYSTDSIIDLQNFETPGVRVGLDYYTMTNLNISKTTTRFISTTNINSDDGWITSQIDSQKFENYERDSESFSFIKNSEDPILAFEIRKSTYILEYTRSYKKIQIVLAEMGGFLKFSFLFFSILCYPVSQFLYYSNISDTLYHFQKEVEDGEKVLRRDIETLRLEMRKISSDTKGFESERSTLKVDEEQLIRYFAKIKEKPLGLSLCEFLRSIFTNNPAIIRKKNQRNKALKSILQRLDIKYFLNKFLEIDKLKFLLLSPDQLQIFEHLPKPMICKYGNLNMNSIDLSRVKRRQADDLLNFSEIGFQKVMAKIEVFTKCFTNILQKNKLDDIDKKLINFIGDELKGIMGINEAIRRHETVVSENQILFTEKVVEITTKEEIDDGGKNNFLKL